MATPCYICCTIPHSQGTSNLNTHTHTTIHIRHTHLRNFHMFFKAPFSAAHIRLALACSHVKREHLLQQRQQSGSSTADCRERREALRRLGEERGVREGENSLTSWWRWIQHTTTNQISHVKSFTASLLNVMYSTYVRTTQCMLQAIGWFTSRPCRQTGPT